MERKYGVNRQVCGVNGDRTIGWDTVCDADTDVVKYYRPLFNDTARQSGGGDRPKNTGCP